MKSLIVTLAVVLATGVTPLLANATDTDPRAEKIFAQRFAGAQHVKWTSLDDGYLRVTFVLNGIGAESFFDKDAEFLGTVRNLFYSQLPLVVIQGLDSRFGGSSVIEVKEITNIDGASYRVVLEQKDKRYRVRLNSLGEITELVKEKIKK
ncbi:MAG: hypothetical protein ACHQFX_09290 [Chitinophagales bacterium]